MLPGDQIKNLRKINALTQEQLADRIGISRQYMSKLEKNEKKPSADIALKLANFFNTSTDIFLKHDDKTDYPERTIEQLMAEMIAIQPIEVPVVGKLHAPNHSKKIFNNDDVIDHVHIARNKAVNKDLVGLRIVGSCLEPDLGDGDTAIIDTNDKSPQNGNIVVIFCKGNQVKLLRYKNVGNKEWFESADERIDNIHCTVQGIVIEVNRRLK